jgi:ABC-type lipoprotein export system ATPase subunit
VLVTHDPEVADACDRVIRMRDGKIREMRTIAAPVEPAATTLPGPELVGVQS